MYVVLSLLVHFLTRLLKFCYFTFKSVDENLRCCHSNETSLDKLLHSTIYLLALIKRNLNFL